MYGISYDMGEATSTTFHYEAEITFQTWFVWVYTDIIWTSSMEQQNFVRRDASPALDICFYTVILKK